MTCHDRSCRAQSHFNGPKLQCIHNPSMYLTSTWTQRSTRQPYLSPKYHMIAHVPIVVCIFTRMDSCAIDYIMQTISWDDRNATGDFCLLSGYVIHILEGLPVHGLADCGCVCVGMWWQVEFSALWCHSCNLTCCLWRYKHGSTHSSHLPIACTVNHQAGSIFLG